MKLSIEKPCQENFEEFTPTQAGGFCQSCQKEVVDFTCMTDAQVLHYFSKNQHKSCGRFSQSQLKTYPEIPIPKRKWNAKWMGASLLSLSLFTILPYSKSQAQLEKVQTRFYLSQGESQQDEGKDIDKKEGIVVEGIVKSEENFPVEGVAVLVKNTERGVFTNEEGKFRFDNLIPGDELIFSYVGYKIENYLVPEKTPQNLTINLDFKLELDICIVTGEVAVDKAYSSKRSFWQRVKGVFR